MVCQQTDFLAPSQKQSTKLGMSAMPQDYILSNPFGFSFSKNKNQPISISF